MQGTQVKARFEIAGFSREGGYEGVHDPNQRWNGWATPRFTAEAARQIAEDTQKDAAAYPESSVVRIENEDPLSFSIIDGGSDDPGDTEFVFADEDGLYGIGNYGWVWEVVGE